MPNLAGVFDASAARAILESQLSRIRCGFEQVVRYLFSEDGLAAALFDTDLLASGMQPVRDAGARIALLLDGEIFNLQELALRSGLSFSTEMEPAALCLALLVQRGPALLKELNGFFILVWYESGPRRLRIASDRFGFRPLFYWWRPSRFAFGTELKAVRAAMTGEPRLDPLGITQLLTFGSHLGTRTWLEDCRRIAPATLLTIDAQAIHEERYWEYAYDESAPRLDQLTYAANVAKLLDRAVERQLLRPGRPAVFLSGGYDSRAVAAAIRPAHLPMPAFTFGTPQSRDARIAPLVAKRLGLEHHLLPNRADYLYANCRAIAWRVEGMLPLHRTTSIQHHEVLAQHAQIFLLGFLGELSGSHTWLRLMLARTRREAIARVFERLTGTRLPLARRVLRAEIFEGLLASLRQEFEAMFETIDNDHPLNMADAWRLRYLHPRTSYQATAVDRYRFEVRAPHIDNELVEFQLRIPVWARIEQRVYKKAIAYSYPQIRDIPCTNSERPIDTLFLREYTRMAADWSVRRLGALGESLLRHRPGIGREITDYASDYRRERRLLTGILEPLIAQGVFDSAFFDVEGIRRLVHEHFDGSAQHEEMLGTLIAWGLAVRYLLLEEYSDLPEQFRPA